MTSIQNVTYCYRRKKILDDVSLELENGVYGLLGPNGAGKTTLMRCIAGVLRPKEGKIIAPSSIGYLPQKFGMFPELTVFEALDYIASLKEVPEKKRKENIDLCIELVHLKSKRDERIRTLSGGMIRRLGIAQTLIGNPELILFDEPTAGLDPEERIRFKNIISQIHDNQTVLISTHVVEDIESLCDHIVLMKQGKVICMGSTDQLRECAAGMVYLVPENLSDHLIKPNLVVGKENINGSPLLRVVSPVHQPGEIVAPSVEDGYIKMINNQL